MFKLKTDHPLTHLKEYLATWSLVDLLLAVTFTVVIGGGVLLMVHTVINPPAPFSFPLPADVCMVDGEPRIISQSTGYPQTQTYLRADGATVKQAYTYDWLTGDVSTGAAAVWFGGRCSAGEMTGNG